MPKEIIPFDQIQHVNQRGFSSLSDVSKWLDSLTAIHDAGNEQKYYLHIDHFQVIPDIIEKPSLNAGDKVYRVIAIYHRVYLERGA